MDVHLLSLPPSFMYPLLQDWLQEPKLNEKDVFRDCGLTRIRAV